MGSDDNPLLDAASQRDIALPFDRITADNMESAIDALITRSEAALDTVKKQDGPRTWDNTMAALDDATADLERAWSLISHLHSVCATSDIREAYAAIVPRVSAWFASLTLDPALYDAVKAYAATPEAESLSGPHKRFLTKTLDDFRRNGAELSEDAKPRFEQISRELATLTTSYSQNVLDATNAWERVFADASSLDGLPEAALALAKASAEEKGETGYRITLQAPSVMSVLRHAHDDALRREVWEAYSSRASRGDHDNGPLIASILDLRREKAELLGYNDFADYVLADRMAKRGDTADRFVDDLGDRSRDAFEREKAALRDFRFDQTGTRELNPWDVSYWSEKQRKALYDFDEEELRPYFSFDGVFDGLFELVGRLYDVSIEPHDLPVWHDDVRTYALRDNKTDRVIGAFYLDFFPRETKRGGAWMHPLITGLQDGAGFTPHTGLICGNLTPPIGDRPALLTHREVETIFHEFGHLLHHLFTTCEIRSLAGTSVAWDFVELPSQIMENWCWEREALDLFATHVDTGEPIPEDLFQKMKRARTYRAGSAMMRQLGFARVDLALHRAYQPDKHGPVVSYARKVMEPFQSTELPNDYAFINAFGHLFASPVGYAAGYYSYKWAEVLEADAFTRFQDEGLFHTPTGAAFRDTILANGDSRDPADLFREFMGRDPDIDPLLRRAGLV